MGLDRDTSIVEDAGEAGRLLSLAGLTRVEEPGGVTLDEMLLASHQWAYDRLRRRFSAAQLALVTNEEGLKLAVASRFAEVLAAQGLLEGGGARVTDAGDRGYWGGQAIDLVDNFRLEFSTGDAPVSTTDGIPVVRNITSRSRGPFFNV